MKDEENSKSGGGKQIRSPEDLRAFAQGYYSTAFPNPEREGCPGTVWIKALAQSETLPDDEARRHFFSCSHCFTEYREAMAAHKNAYHIRPASRWKSPLSSFSMKPIGVLAAAAFLIFITAALGIIVHNKNKNSQPSPVAQDIPEPAAGQVNADLDRPTNNSAAANPAAAGRSSSRQRPKSPSQPAGRGPRDLIATVAIRIDLREDVLRAVEEAQNREEKLIELPPSRMSLSFDLPEGSNKGVYEVKIVDPFGNALKSAKGVSRDGKRLKVLLDLRGLDEARYRLCVSRASEAPDCYQVLITNGIVKR
jgi:hypothetical protein